MTDLLDSSPIWMLQVDPDKAFAVQMAHEESVVSTAQAYMQCALLYTSSQGERRIRYSLCPPILLAVLLLMSCASFNGRSLALYCAAPRKGGGGW